MPVELDKWVSGYKVRAFPWIDGKRIYFNVQYYAPGKSVDREPVWDKTVYIVDNDAGKRVAFTFPDSLVQYVAGLKIPVGSEIVLDFNV